MKEDERYQVVEEAIDMAFQQLVATQPPDKISVRDVINRAGIARSTFYNHYVDMPSLIEAQEDRSISRILAMMEDFHPTTQEESLQHFFLSLCRYIEKDHFVAGLIKTPEAPDFIRKMLLMFHAYDAQIKQVRYESEHFSEENMYAIAYAIGGALGVLHKWTSDSLDMSPVTIATYLAHIFSEGVLKYIEW
ncbi:MAG: TetR/AcrR family transcriptional regulator [Lachnospiraceae bacterium]|nr:TetR/AcrR family transcriptional regulator [Lachnospiraceae bacterium]